MGDDQVTIDPEFGSPSHGPDEQGRGLRRIVVLVIAAAAIVIAWLLAAPSATEPDETDEAAVPSTTIERTTSSTAALRPAAAPPPGGFAGLDVSLAEEVPGFSDTIVMLATPPSNFEVIRWPAASPSAGVTLSLDRDGEGWGSGIPSGLDASGRWFAERFEDGLLVVHDTTTLSSEPEPIDVRVVESVWHDIDPGRIAWLTCSRAGDSGTLLSLDLADELAEPVELGTVEEGCGDAWPWHWGRRGLVLGHPFFSDTAWLYPEGSPTPIALDAELVAEAPDGTTMWAGTDEEAAVFLLSPDGRRRSEVPGVGPDDAPVAALWSPDGAHLALFFEAPQRVLRIVETGSGGVLGGIWDAGLELVDGAWAWSTDGRFLLFQRARPGGWELVFYDIETHSPTEVPLRDIVDEIRTTSPGPRGAFISPLPGGSTLEVDASGAAATGGTEVPNIAGALLGDDGGERLPLGTVNELPDDHRLDFFYERCDFAPDCYRDAVFVGNDDPSLGSAAWVAGRPFIVRHGFINAAEEPLDDTFDVVVYSFEMDHEGARGPTIRYTSDYVVRGRTNQCGPTYRTLTGPVVCEWFVHEFPDGLPAGRHALWAVWQAPCSAWIDYGFVDSCTDPDEVLELFASGVDSPWEPTEVIWEPR